MPIDTDLVKRLCRELAVLRRQCDRKAERAHADAERLLAARREHMQAIAELNAKIDELVAASAPGGEP